METRIPFLTILTVGLLPGFLKRFIYRRKGFKIGKKVRFSLGSVIVCRNYCEIKDHVSFGFFAILKVNTLFIGHHTMIRSLAMITANDVRIGNDVIISETAIIRAGHLSARSNLTVKDRVHIFPKTIIDPSWPILLDEECAVGFYTNIFTHGSYKNILEGYRVQYGEVTIGKRVELTYNVFVAPGVSIGDDAIIAYGSYVNHDIPAGVLAAGTPARVKRKKDEFAPVPSPEEKEKIIRSIIDDFGGYLEFSGTYKRVARSSDEIEFMNKSGRFRLFFITGSSPGIVFSATDLIILFNTGNLYDELIRSGDKQVFDLSALKCPPDLKKNGLELRKFFSRYGIRFPIHYD